ncbi:MAG: hypothetical protein Q8S33_36595 [Myxococcales bacterium]|nr:hypothetical protein [Myxococcales bacterium]
MLTVAGIVVAAAAAYGGYRWWDHKTGSLSRPLLEALRSAGEQGATWTEIRRQLGLTSTGWLTSSAATILQRMCAAGVVEQDSADPERYRIRQGLQVEFAESGNTIIRGPWRG